MIRPARVLAAALLLALAACSKHVSFSGEAKLKPTAEENYQAGQELLKDGSYPEAQKFFDYVRTKFPFSKYAALADLRLADAKFAQGQFAEAAEAYKQFVQLHPNARGGRLRRVPGGRVLPQGRAERVRALPADVREGPAPGEEGVRRAPRLRQEVPGLRSARRTRRSSSRDADGRLAAHEWYVAEYYYQAPPLGGRRRTLRDPRRQVPRARGTRRRRSSSWRTRTSPSTRSSGRGPRSRSSSSSTRRIPGAPRPRSCWRRSAERDRLRSQDQVEDEDQVHVQVDVQVQLARHRAAAPLLLRREPRERGARRARPRRAPRARRRRRATVAVARAAFRDVEVAADGPRARVLAVVDADGSVRLGGREIALAYVGREAFEMERCPATRWCPAGAALPDLAGVVAAVAAVPRDPAAPPRRVAGPGRARPRRRRRGRRGARRRAGSRGSSSSSSGTVRGGGSPRHLGPSPL